MSDRRVPWARVAPLALLLLLAGATLLGDTGWLRLPSADGRVANRVEDALDGMPARPVVLVGFDPDLGTYAEVRPTVRSLLADLLQRDARIAFVSLTAEGRALLLGELDRLDRLDVNPRRVLDLGFIPGAEAALVGLARGPFLASAETALANRLRADGAAAIDGVVVVGGNDLGPRTWVEQFLPRVDRPLIAIAPTVLLPELQPYLGSGQIDALLGTPRDGAAYRITLDLENLGRFADDRGPAPIAVLVGLLAAAVVLLHALGRRLVAAAREARGREES
jgi:hypothetical protein